MELTLTAADRADLEEAPEAPKPRRRGK